MGKKRKSNYQEIIRQKVSSDILPLLKLSLEEINTKVNPLLKEIYECYDSIFGKIGNKSQIVKKSELEIGQIKTRIEGIEKIIKLLVLDCEKIGKREKTISSSDLQELIKTPDTFKGEIEYEYKRLDGLFLELKLVKSLLSEKDVSSTLDPVRKTSNTTKVGDVSSTLSSVEKDLDVATTLNTVYDDMPSLISMK